MSDYLKDVFTMVAIAVTFWFLVAIAWITF